MKVCGFLMKMNQALILIENDKILGEENDIIKNNEEKGIELLCLYLKNSEIINQK